MTGRRFAGALVLVLAVAGVLRPAYILAQPAADPSFARPMLDGEYYLAWARALAAGRPGPPGAFYLAPLYPWLLSVFLRVFGESFRLLYLLQHALVLAAAGMLAVVSRRIAGSWAGIATAVLAVFYHPALFFASRPVGEALGLFVLSGALLAAAGGKERSSPGTAAAGILSGLASLARPNLLAVPALWAARGAVRRRWRPALLLAAGAAVVIGPVAVRNLVVSGHLVPISSNAGLTLYHGNGPGAEGVYTPPEGFSGRVADQRREATVLASRRAGRSLDPVQADRWFARAALRARAAHPWGTVRLLARRVSLLLANAELGLDYAPSLDRNRWRRAAPVPFALLLALALAGAAILPRAAGGKIGAALLATALAPVLFYVSSRYRLPFAFLLAVPAGVGAAGLAGGVAGIPAARRGWGAAIGALLLVASLLVPTGAVRASLDAGALANRGAAWKAAGRLDAAERDLQAALALDPSSTAALFNLGVVVESRGKLREAERLYRKVLAADPGHAEAAGNLARLLVREGRPGDAIPILERALAARPGHRVCWTNLVVAHAALGDLAGARDAAHGAARAGVRLDPALLRAIGGTGEGGESGAREESGE